MIFTSFFWSPAAIIIWYKGFGYFHRYMYVELLLTLQSFIKILQFWWGQSQCFLSWGFINNCHNCHCDHPFTHSFCSLAGLFIHCFIILFVHLLVRPSVCPLFVNLFVHSFTTPSNPHVTDLHNVNLLVLCVQLIYHLQCCVLDNGQKIYDPFNVDDVWFAKYGCSLESNLLDTYIRDNGYNIIVTVP